MGWAQRQPRRRPGAGTVVMLASGAVRYAEAVQCLMALDVPRGTRLECFNGCVDVPYNRNEIARRCRGNWLLMIDDDHVFAPDTATRLLSHLADDAIDIVVPLVLRKDPPHDPVLWAAADGSVRRVQLSEQSGGVIQVLAAGTGMMLIRRRVFEALAAPWFEHAASMTHDVAFCVKARAAGFTIVCDLETRIGHVLPMAVWPTRLTDGRWTHAIEALNIGSPADVLGMVGRVASAPRESVEDVEAGRWASQERVMCHDSRHTDS